MLLDILDLNDVICFGARLHSSENLLKKIMNAVLLMNTCSELTSDMQYCRIEK